MTVKIGDYVKIKPGVVAVAGFTVGKPYLVEKLERIGVDQANVQLRQNNGVRTDYFSPNEYELVSVTPKVGDTIRATRGESSLVGEVVYSSNMDKSYAIILDGKPEIRHSIFENEKWQIEIIKPKVVLPTGRFAVIKLSGMFPHFLTEGKGWLQTTTQTSTKSYFTEEEILKKMESEGRTLEILFEGVDIP